MDYTEITYPELMIGRCIDERRMIFDEVSPEKKCELIQIHIDRYLANNISRLDEDQIALIEQGKSMVTPGSFTLPRPVDQIKALQTFDRQLRERFSGDEGRQVFTLDGDYQPAVGETYVPAQGGCCMDENSAAQGSCADHTVSIKPTEH